MALSAAFSMARIIIGVANTGGSIASLNWLARCAGVTRSVKVPFAPSGIGRMRPIIGGLPRKDHPLAVGIVEEQSYFQSTGCMKSSAAHRKSSRDRARLRATPVSPVRTCTACKARTPKELMRGYCLDIGGDHGRVVRGLQLTSLHALSSRHPSARRRQYRSCVE